MKKIEEIIKEIEYNTVDTILDCSEIVLQNDSVILNIPGCQKALELKRNHLNHLLKNKRINNIHNLDYFDHCGFSYDKYGEFFIIFHDSEFKWLSQNDLKFKIDNTLISIGPCSKILTLLLGQYYYDDHFGQSNFTENYSSLKIIGSNLRNSHKIVHESLYYLNSYYLNPLKDYVNIFHMLSPNDPYPFWYGDDGFKKIDRKRIRNRKSFYAADPLILYNIACELEDESQYLGFYRVLEYFFNKNIIKHLHDMRFNTNVSENEIVQFIQKKDEKSLLYNLLQKCITINKINRLTKYAYKNKLIERDDFNLFVSKIYSYRNSIVHSKQEQHESTLIPDPMTKNVNTVILVQILKSISKQIINYLNIKNDT